MEFRHLQSFMTVARTGSLVSAAKALNIAQPALSRQMQALERELGVMLFERHARGISLTRAGRGFRADARRVLAAAARARARVQAAPRLARSSLTIGYGELLAYWPSLAVVLQRFRADHPLIDLHAVPIARPRVRPALRGGEVDLVVMATPEWPVHGLAGMRVADASLSGALLPADHPAASRATVTPADLAPLVWFHLAPDATMGCFEFARAELKRAGFHAKDRVVRIGSFAGLPPVAAGDGWALADAHLARAVTAATTAIVYRPFDGPPIPTWVALLWKRQRESDAVRAFLAVARKVCRPRWSD